MASIAFCIDNREGHILPTFEFSHQLKKAGHHIIYLSVLDNEKMVREQGFDFFPLFKDICPLGYNTTVKEAIDRDDFEFSREAVMLSGLMAGEFDLFFKQHNPDLFLGTSFWIVEWLILHYKYGIHWVIVTTHLRSPDISLAENCSLKMLEMPTESMARTVDWINDLGNKPGSLRDLVKPLVSFPELILCPLELEMDQQPEKSGRHYIGPSIREEKQSEDYLGLNEIRKDKKIIYASLGTNATGYWQAAAFFKKVINVMRHPEMEDHHLILAVGKEWNDDFSAVSDPNISVFKWLSQTEVIKRASLVITHGGLGTIKESIFHGVPMIVLPIKYDTPRNAMLVEYHRLGISEQIEHLTEEDLRADILYVLGNTRIGESVQRMKRIFREKEEMQEGVKIIGDRLKQQSMKLVNLKDDNFPHQEYVSPFYLEAPFKWDRSCSQEGITVYTDAYLTDSLKARDGEKISWLVEPISINPYIYSWITLNYALFREVWTHDHDVMRRVPNARFIPTGGCWIEPESIRIAEKSKICSFIASNKNITVGHKMRWDIRASLPSHIPQFGKGFNQIKLKSEALNDYAYSIAVENIQRDAYFTEKLIDCFLTGTIPIYWGTKKVKDYFDGSGIIFFEGVSELLDILRGLSLTTYHEKINAVRTNFELAKQFILPEGWMKNGLLFSSKLQLKREFEPHT